MELKAAEIHAFPARDTPYRKKRRKGLYFGIGLQPEPIPIF